MKKIYPLVFTIVNYGVTSDPYFLAFGLNTEIYCTPSEYRKTWTRNNSVFGHFSRSGNDVNCLLIQKKQPKMLAGQQGCNFIEKWLQHRYFSVNIAKFFRASILKSICRWMLLFIAFKNNKWCRSVVRMTPPSLVWFLLHVLFLSFSFFFSLLFVKSTTSRNIEVNLSVFMIKRYIQVNWNIEVNCICNKAVE